MARCAWSILKGSAASLLIRACPPIGEPGRIATASAVARGNLTVQECVVPGTLRCMLKMIAACAAYRQKLTAATNVMAVEWWTAAVSAAATISCASIAKAHCMATRPSTIVEHVIRTPPTTVHSTASESGEERNGEMNATFAATQRPIPVV